MKQASKIFLIGPMGAGKSTIGRMLAKELRLPFKDSDREIEARTGADIPWIFDVEGEDGFRKREVAVIDEFTQFPKIVLATGGGAIIEPDNRTNLSSRGTVIYLEASVSQQIERTRRDKTRPLLQTDDPEGVLDRLFEQRAPLYMDIADLVVPTNQGNPKFVVKRILDYLSD